MGGSWAEGTGGAGNKMKDLCSPTGAENDFAPVDTESQLRFLGFCVSSANSSPLP